MLIAYVGQPPSAVRASEAQGFLCPSRAGSVRFRTADAAKRTAIHLRISFEGKSLSVAAVSQAEALVMRLLRILIVMLTENAVSPMSAAREHDAFTGGFANFPVPNHFVH